MDDTRKTLKTFNNWVKLSDYIKGLVEKGAINFDVISNQTLLAVILSEMANEQLQAFMKDYQQ